MKTIGEIKEEFSAAREADWNAICQMYETDLRSGVQKLVQQYRKKLEALEKEKAGIPLGRGETPEEIAEAGINMMRSGFITGEILNINGGAFMRP